MIRRLVVGVVLGVAILMAAAIALLSDGTRPPAELRRQLVILGAIGAVAGAGLSALYASAISRRIRELRDVASALAAGDMTRRPRLAAPGEVGELAIALHLLGEQLDARLSALQAEEDLSRAYFDALNEGVMAVSARREVVRINDAARRLLGVLDAVPIPLDRLPRDRALREAIEGAIAGESREAEEVAFGARTLALTARPVREGAVVALLDLTATRRLERVRSDFVANVSHELKTPLTVIGGFAETLLDDDLPDDRRVQFIESIRTNAARMQALVDDLLDLSRIESGGWVPAPVDLTVRNLLHEVAAGIRENAFAKGLDVRVEVGIGAEHIYADATAARQIIGNLAENAVRYTHEGLVTLFSKADSQGVWIGVRDTGIGVPAEHLPRIFERFYRVDAARSRSLGGTGLGLAIVRHLTEAHGGDVRATSVVGRGTEISARLPASAMPV